MARLKRTLYQATKQPRTATPKTAITTKVRYFQVPNSQDAILSNLSIILRQWMNP